MIYVEALKSSRINTGRNARVLCSGTRWWKQVPATSDKSLNYPRHVSVKSWTGWSWMFLQLQSLSFHCNFLFFWRRHLWPLLSIYVNILILQKNRIKGKLWKGLMFKIIENCKSTDRMDCDNPTRPQMI